MCKNKKQNIRKEVLLKTKYKFNFQVETFEVLFNYTYLTPGRSRTSVKSKGTILKIPCIITKKNNGNKNLIYKKLMNG